MPSTTGHDGMTPPPVPESRSQHLGSPPSSKAATLEDGASSATGTPLPSSNVIDLGSPSGSSSLDDPQVPIFSSYITTDMGNFALEDIPAGTRVLQEEPIMTLGADDLVDAMIKKFDQLTPAEQKSIMAMTTTALPQLDKLSRHIDSLVPWVELMDSKPVIEWTADEKLLFDKLGPYVRYHIKAWELASRVWAHCFSISPISSDERTPLHPNVQTYGVFARASHFRKSCVPNCHLNWNVVNGYCTIHTTKFVHLGEALTQPSLNSTVVWYEGHRTRTETLKGTPVGQCDCEACDLGHPNFLKHEEVRAALPAYVNSVNDFLDKLNRYENPKLGLQFGMHSPMPSLPSYHEFVEAERAILKILKNLRITGCGDTELIRWRITLIDRVFYYMDGKERAVEAHTSIAARIASRCLGADCPMMIDLQAQAIAAKNRAQVLNSAESLAVMATARGGVRAGKHCAEVKAQRGEQTKGDNDERYEANKGKGKSQAKE